MIEAQGGDGGNEADDESQRKMKTNKRRRLSNQMCLEKSLQMDELSRQRDDVEVINTCCMYFCLFVHLQPVHQHGQGCLCIIKCPMLFSLFFSENVCQSSWNSALIYFSCVSTKQHQSEILSQLKVGPAEASE